MIPSCMKQTSNTKNTVIFKRVFDTESIEIFKQKLYETSWDDVKSPKTLRKNIKVFWLSFSDLYDTYFPKKQIKLKSKDLQSPWITNGINKSSMQSLYEKFLKNRIEKMSLNTKLTRNFMNQLKNKKLHFPNK